jgi:hypothetical protein
MTAVDSYRFLWWVLYGGLVAVGTAVAVLVLSLSTWVLLGLVACVAVVTAMLGQASKDETTDHDWPFWLVARRVLAGLLALTATLGLGDVLHARVLLIGLLMVALSPPVGGRLLFGSSVGATTPADRAPATSTSTQELCREWCSSYVALSQAVTPSARLRIVMSRQWCLDELERRHPDGLQAWLESAASAGGDPARFLH